MDRRSDRALADLRVSASPAAIRQRLLARLLPVRSLWFASHGDQRAWSQAGVPLYVLRDRADDADDGDVAPIEVGPRLGSLWASCFAPVLDGRFAREGADTTIHFRIRWPRPTLGLVLAWWVVLLGWALAIATGRTEGQPTVFWVFLALMSTIGPGLGWQLGRRALEEAWPFLVQAIEQPEVDEDW